MKKKPKKLAMTLRERAVAFIAKHLTIVMHGSTDSSLDIYVSKYVMISYEKLCQDLAEEFARMEKEFLK